MEFRIVQAGIGKSSFDASKLVEDVTAFADAVSKAKPAGAKGQFGPRCEGRSDERAGQRVGAVSASHKSFPASGLARTHLRRVLDSDHRQRRD